MTYHEAVDWLFNQFPAYHTQGVSAYKPGLDNVLELAEAFGNPQNDLHFIHVAGTNGKGSVSNLLASIFAEHGMKTGLFTSPHIFDFTERIRVNGETIDEAFVVAFCKQIQQHHFSIAPSFFEITWVMALCYFRDRQCEIVIAETGLGGRLDATNVILPKISIITNISLDHTAILGTTREAIAGEKAGIIKAGVPVVVGQKDKVSFVFEKKALEAGSPLFFSSPASSYPEGIKGYQRENFDTVTTALAVLNQNGYDFSSTDVENGIRNLRKNTHFFGRMEVVGQMPAVILDCAHNPEGIEKLLESLDATRKLHIVYGTSSDKDFAAIRKLLPKNAAYYFTEFSNPRSASLEQLQEHFNDLSKEAHFFKNPLEALHSAKLSANEEDTVVVFGSFFLAADFFEEFSQKRLSK